MVFRLANDTFHFERSMKKKAGLWLSIMAKRSWWMVRATWRRPGAEHLAAHTCKLCTISNLGGGAFQGENTEWCQRPERERSFKKSWQHFQFISILCLSGVLSGVGWIPVGLSGDAAIINRQSEVRASVHKGIAESSEIIGADFSPQGEDYLCSPVVRK